VFETYLTRWDLVVDGKQVSTPSSRLLPVRYCGIPAILKVAVVEEERRGGLLMKWWNGEGAARVLAHEKDALLLERGEEEPSLVEMVKAGNDDEATRIICSVAARLHAPRAEEPSGLIPLTRWFRELGPAAAKHGGVFTQSAAMARTLLEAPQEAVVLHGDIHHGNILHFASDGWLAIDPKALVGERGFDFANLFCNPDFEIARRDGRLARQSHIVAEAAGLSRTRLLQWIVAYSGLSAAWLLEENLDPTEQLTIARIARGELSECRES
jgi:streptomycin 6-kinase